MTQEDTWYRDTADSVLEVAERLYMAGSSRIDAVNTALAVMKEATKVEVARIENASQETAPSDVPAEHRMPLAEAVAQVIYSHSEVRDDREASCRYCDEPTWHDLAKHQAQKIIDAMPFTLMFEGDGGSE